MRKLIHSVKYDHRPRLGAQIGEWVARQLVVNDAIHIPEPALLVAVPLHSVRVKERGYNQSECIARGISRILQLPWRSDLLKRIRYTRSQTRLNRSQRRQNVANAFTLSSPDLNAFRSVVLVDDLVTTGATMNECARTLKQAGVQHILGMAVATPVNLGDEALEV
ncbi:MAG: ComF family protein [Calditrichaeota bacterium]|nr:ComF family protein [Calditrichota bacterium]